MLIGSEQFRLSDAINQSLAGRTALLRQLPFSLEERQLTGASEAVDDLLYSGFYPRILDQKLDPWQALGDYFETYVERDVRRIGEIRNLSFYRNAGGLECDLFYETGSGIGAIEVKAGATVSPSYFTALNRIAEVVSGISAGAVV